MTSLPKRPRTTDVSAPDLFGRPVLPEGFRYTSDVLSIGEEKSLIRQFEKLLFKPYEFRGVSANRRIFTFGANYLFAGQERRDDSAIPDYLQPLQIMASEISGMPAKDFEQVMVSEYAPGAGIGWHRDRPQYEHVVGVSFLAPCAFRFRRKIDEGWERRSALVEPRSIYLLSGAARNVWQHSIVPLNVLRYSVTLRTFRPEHQVLIRG